jgi:hypothetical protein
MNVDACTCLPTTTAVSRLDLRVGVSLPGPLRRAGLPRPEPDASGTGRGGASAAALISAPRHMWFARSWAILPSR